MDAKAWRQFADDCEARKVYSDDHIRMAAVARELANALEALAGIKTLLTEYEKETAPH